MIWREKGKKSRDKGYNYKNWKHASLCFIRTAYYCPLTRRTSIQLEVGVHGYCVASTRVSSQVVHTPTHERISQYSGWIKQWQYILVNRSGYLVLFMTLCCIHNLLFISTCIYPNWPLTITIQRPIGWQVEDMDLNNKISTIKNKTIGIHS